MRTFGQYVSLLKHMGPAWLLYRVGYAMRRRSGHLRRAAPAMTWDQVPVSVLRLHSGTKPAGSDSWGGACVAEAEAILHGEFRLFSHRMVKADFPPDWMHNQISRKDWPQKGAKSAEQCNLSHWTEILDSSGGDIKGVWELSRFAWAFTLARAHARTGDWRYADGFWRLFADWCRHNPPNQGPNWMCGQEATFRLMAVIFATETLGVPAEQEASLARFVEATGRRIAANLDYALSQKNNHGISECVGLITVALLLPDHGKSAGWLERGLGELQKQLAELVYEDGGFSQHSLFYHRVLLHDLCWCRRRLELAGKQRPVWLDEAAGRTLDYLTTITNPETGGAPLYGSNDGANVLPLSDTAFLDMRSVIQMAAAVFCGELVLPAGPWDEAAAWMKPDWASIPRKPWPVPPALWHAPVAGCFQLAHGCDRLFLRCPTVFRHRPSQADMLHVDVWHTGRPVVFDGGTYSYNSPERFTALKKAAHHNVLTVDGVEPLTQFSRFLYLPWPKGTVEGGQMAEDSGRISEDGNAPQAEKGHLSGTNRHQITVVPIVASHDGYAKLGVSWSRAVAPRPEGGFVVRDRVTGAANHRLTWHWRLVDLSWQQKSDCLEVHAQDCSYRISWTGPANIQSRLLRADTATAHGWWSPYYGAVEPAVALSLEVEATGDVELVTEFQPGE